MQIFFFKVIPYLLKYLGIYVPQIYKENIASTFNMFIHFDSSFKVFVKCLY